MGDFLKAIFENWEVLPSWVRVAILIIILGLGLAIVLNKFIPVFKFFLKIFGKNKIKLEEEIGYLKNHHFFEYLQHLLSYKIKSIDLGDEGRNYIMKEKLIPLHISETKKNFENFINETKFTEISSLEVKKLLIQKIYDSLKNFEQELISTASSPEEHSVVKLVLDYFNDFNLPNGELVISLINDIFDSSIYLNNNISKVNSSLYIMIMPYELLFEGVEKIFRRMNGNLSGKSYHGKKFK